MIRDLDALRGLIAERLAGLARGAALERLWLFLETATPVERRFHGRDEAMAAVYRHAAGDLGRLLAGHDPQMAANSLADAMVVQAQAWAEWLPATLEHTPSAVARIALEQARARQERAAGWLTLIRRLADAAGDVEAFREIYGPGALATPAVAVAVARRYMAAGRVEAAGDVLRGAAPKPNRAGRLAASDFDWETAWIDYLERTGDAEAAQAVRWNSFERTLDVSRARAFVARLTGFDDVEAEARAFAHARGIPISSWACGF